MVDERGAQARTHGAGVTGAIECRYYGRDFTAGEMALLRALIAGPPPLNRHMLSKEFCRKHRLVQARRRPQGHDGQGRHAGHAQGRPDRPAGAAGTAEPARADRLRAGHRSAAVPGPDDPRRGPSARPAVVRGTRESKLWNEFVATTISDTRPWSAPRCATPSTTARLAARHARLLHRRVEAAPRDNFIGWTRQLREKNLPFVVDNPRFLILPWINIPNLGSHIRHHPPAPSPMTSGSSVLIGPSSRPRATPAPRASGWTRVDHPGARALRPGQAVRRLKRMSGSGPCDGIGNWPQSLKSAGAMETPALIPRPERTLTSMAPGRPPASTSR